MSQYLHIASTIFMWWLIVSFALINFTWVYFAAIMRMRELRDTGKLAWKVNPELCFFSYLNLFIGLLLDVALNFWVATVVMLELPREALTTSRLSRWLYTTKTDWWTRNVRIRFVRFGQAMLDQVDTDGRHIK